MKKIKKTIAIAIMLITILQINNYFSVSVKAGTSDLAGLESGTTYYIRNVSTGKYLDVQGGTDKNGQNVIVYNYIGGNNQKWKLKRISGYTYTFLTKLSSARAMNVSSSNIDIKNDSSASSQKFVLSRNTDGTYYIKYGSKYVVVTDGKNVGLSTSTSNAKWSFDEVTKSDADIYGFKYKNGKILFFDTTFDSTGCYSQFKSGFSSAGYSTYAFTNKPASTAYNYMKSDSIFIFSGHGVYTGTKGTIPMATIAFFDSNGNWQKNSSGNFDGYITADSAISSCCPINKLATNQLSSAKCIMYVGCGTGVSYKVGNTSYNLVSATYKKGAHFVLGTEDEVKTAKASEWINDFSYKASKSGSTIADCLSYANYFIGNIPVCTAGDKNCRLNY